MPNWFGPCPKCKKRHNPEKRCSEIKPREKTAKKKGRK